MSFAPVRQCDLGLVEGSFREADHGCRFEYSAPELGEFVPFAGYEQKIWVGPAGEQYRWAKILKTVAYIVVDEAADGSPVVERWFVNQHRSYARLRA